MYTTNGKRKGHTTKKQIHAESGYICQLAWAIMPWGLGSNIFLQRTKRMTLIDCNRVNHRVPSPFEVYLRYDCAFTIYSNSGDKQRSRYKQNLQFQPQVYDANSESRGHHELKTTQIFPENTPGIPGAHAAAHVCLCRGLVERMLGVGMDTPT